MIIEEGEEKYSEQLFLRNNAVRETTCDLE